MQSLTPKLLHWFHENARDLPWRRTYSPYHVWISEIMLQQTQMDRAVNYFTRWMERLPDIETVASSIEEEILKLWEGLGYYSRAANIIKTAKILLARHDGQLPADFDQLLKLPGIGQYTAGAIMSIAFNREHVIIDANIERVFARLFNIDKPVKDKKTYAFINKKAADLMPKGRAREYNQALMELGGLICLPRNPRCLTCPINEHCLARRENVIEKRPLPVKTSQTVFIEMATGILRHGGKIFIQKRKAHGVWANLWEFPGGRLEPGETPEMALSREFAEETELQIGRLDKITTVQHAYTIYRVTLHGYFCSLRDGHTKPVLHGAQEYRWVTPDELAGYAFPAGHRKLIEYLKKEQPRFFKE